MLILQSQFCRTASPHPAPDGRLAAARRTDEKHSTPALHRDDMDPLPGLLNVILSLLPWLRCHAERLQSNVQPIFQRIQIVLGEVIRIYTAAIAGGVEILS